MSKEAAATIYRMLQHAGDLFTVHQGTFSSMSGASPLVICWAMVFDLKQSMPTHARTHLSSRIVAFESFQYVVTLDSSHAYIVKRSAASAS
jgi:hypothetical protein